MEGEVLDRVLSLISRIVRLQSVESGVSAEPIQSGTTSTQWRAAQLTSNGLQKSHIPLGPHLHPFTPFLRSICPFVASQYLSTSSSTTFSHGLGPPATRGGAIGVSALTRVDVGAGSRLTTLPERVVAVVGWAGVVAGAGAVEPSASGV